MQGSVEGICPEPESGPLPLCTGGVRVLTATPAPETGKLLSTIRVTEAAGEDKIITRRFSLPGISYDM